MASQSIWIVGASSGIGASLALAYARQGHRIFISARSYDGLASLGQNYHGVDHNSDIPKQGELICIPMDVTDKDSVALAITQIQAQTSNLNRVIINAGTCEYVDDVQLDLALVRRVMETNFFGAIQVSNQVLPLLQHGDKPQLVFVSSSVTYQSLPRAHAYGARKAALRYFVECLKIDAQQLGIDVRIVSPGFVKTPLTDKNDFDMPFMVSSDEAASRIMQGLNHARFDVNFPKRFTWLLKIFSWFPIGLKFKCLGKMSRYDSDTNLKDMNKLAK